MEQTFPKEITTQDVILKRNQIVNYKDSRVLKVVQIDEKRKRIELIEGEWNPFWCNYSDVKPLPPPPQA